MNRPGFLIHNHDDQVGVATHDLKSGDTVTGKYLEDGREIRIMVRDDIPLGHKIALDVINKSANVLEYGFVIGQATSDIDAGGHVHTHNLKSMRW